MTVGELREICQSMKEYGISYLKMGDAVIKRSQSVHVDAPMSSEIGSGPDKDVGSLDPIEHKLEQMSSLMKLNDSELVDALFPVDEEKETI